MSMFEEEPPPPPLLLPLPFPFPEDELGMANRAATNVPGKKNIPRMEMVFMAAESRCVSTAMERMTALSSLEAAARREDEDARDMLTLESFWVMNW